MMSRRRRNTPDPQPEPTQPAATPAPDAAILERLALLEKTISGDDIGPTAVHNRQVLEEQARDTRPPGPGPVPHCSYCGLEDSATGWRRTPSARGGWACTGCSIVANPPFVNGRRTVPHSHDVPGLLASAHFDIDPIPWLLAFGQRYGLDWPYATEPSSTAWAHVGDLAQWRKVAALAVDRQTVGMNYLPPFDWDVWRTAPGPDMRWAPVRDLDGGYRSQLVEVQPKAPDLAEVERQALAQLEAEEKDVARRLKVLRRQEKEAAAAASEAAAMDARRSEIHDIYVAHRQRLEQQHKAELRELRRAQDIALEREGLL